MAIDEEIAGRDPFLFHALAGVDKRSNGKRIRRTLERRFDAVLEDIVKTDADALLELPYARWLLDNTHIVREALQQIEIDLPRSYFRQLVKKVPGEQQGVPRVFAFVAHYVEQGDLPFNLQVLEASLAEHPEQIREHSAMPVTLGELWAVPTALRISLIARLCEAVPNGDREHSQPADDSDDIERQTGIVAGCITSLRAVATTNWREFVERASVVERTLRNDPMGVYGQMDFRTRDRYRKRVEAIARHCSASQDAVAKTALRLAEHSELAENHPYRRHIGYYLVDRGRARLEAEIAYRPPWHERITRLAGRHGEGLYVFAISALSLAGSFGLFLALTAHNTGPLASAGAAMLALVPLLSVASGAVNALATALIAPRRLPKIDLSGGIPDDRRALVVMPMLLNGSDETNANLVTLEQNYLANPDPLLRFALLSDFCDADGPDTEEDDLLLAEAVAGIDALNERYRSDGTRPFLLFHRRRLWNENAQRWMGWERKRGKLEELNALLRGAVDTSYVLHHGEDLPFNEIRYVITLDADSYMPPGTARRLIGALAHPLNEPYFDAGGQHVRRGYTIVQPRLEINPVTGSNTRFARIFAGDTLLDLYTHAVSDVYQDLFDNAVYTGKGIYDLDAFVQSAEGRIDSNTILSHDLLEGLLGRVGLASDTVVLEDYPPNYIAYLKRLHRWVRGDWQLLPWLFRRASNGYRFRPGLTGRWKIFDNLRRSLVTPTMLLLLLGGWLWLAENPYLWTLLFALFPGLPILLRAALALRTSMWRWGTIGSSLRNLGGQAGADAARWVLALVFLPVEAYLITDAVVRTLYRVIVSRRALLEWSTAAAVAQSAGALSAASAHWRQLWIGPATAFVAGAAVALTNPRALPAALPFLVFWALSPWVAWRLARQQRQEPDILLSEEDSKTLRDIARDTWKFFEHFVGPNTAWLPPDNVQEYPSRTIALRTSPTNIGMLLLSTLAAYDLGYLGLRQLVARLANCLSSISLLERHRGHLLNWYTIPDRQPMEPHYVSTVDSGNFVAALIVVRQALADCENHDTAPDRTAACLADDLSSLRNQLFPKDGTVSDPAVRQLREALDTVAGRLSHAEDIWATAQAIDADDWAHVEAAFLTAVDQAPEQWSDETIACFRESSQAFRQHLRTILRDVEFFAPWTQRLHDPAPSALESTHQSALSEIREELSASSPLGVSQARLYRAEQQIRALRRSVSGSTNGSADVTAASEAIDWLDALLTEINGGYDAIEQTNESRETLIADVEELIEQTDFAFLYDANRDLFRVGYNVSTGELDSSYYDLLTSEARLASFIAIAKGDVPARHWMHLGRPLTRIRGLRILLSWSATAFEYLMPRLVMHTPQKGLLSQSSEGAIEQQMRTAHKFDIPWGVSESGYAHLDPQGHYQYYAFGVPRLGLKWDQGERLVISAYASALALPYRPKAVAENMRQLINLKASGPYGLFEAIDFGAAQQPHRVHPDIVRSYMAHHQGMILVAIANALDGDRMLDRFHSEPRIASVEYLLYERLPQRTGTHPLERLPAPLKERAATSLPIEEWQVPRGEREFAVVSNGRLSCRLSDQGGSALYWRDKAVTRWNPLTDGPLGGSCLYVRDQEENRTELSLGASELPDNVETHFAPHKIEFRALHDDVLIRTAITVAPSADVQIQKVAITNHSAQPRRLLVASYCEPVLARDADDRRHPAFSKLFLEMQRHGDDGDILLCRRRHREADVTDMHLAQTAIVEAGQGKVRVHTDRPTFLGRNGSYAAPVALHQLAPGGAESSAASLDQCAAVSVILDIAPYATAQCVFLTAVGVSSKSALAQLRRFPSIERADWAMEESALHSERELTRARMNSETVRDSFRVLAQVTWPTGLGHVDSHAAQGPGRTQDILWRHGISGDRPIVTLLIDGSDDLRVAESVLRVLAYLDSKDVAIDVVFLDESKGGYAAPVQDRLRKLVNKHLPGSRNGASGYVVPVRNISAREKSDLIAAARFFIDRQDGDLQKALARTRQNLQRMPVFVPHPSAPINDTAIAPVSHTDDLLLSHRLGGLLPDLGGYSLLISADQKPPAPWCNVLANPQFGTLVSESGSMCTWWRNSSEYRLTPWSNDAVLDRSGEAVYIRDEETGEVWTLTPGSQTEGPAYRVTHAIGESTFEHNRHGLEQELRVFVDAERPLKTLLIRLANRWPRERRLTVTYVAEWVLGPGRDSNAHLLVPERDHESGALLVRNGFSRNDGGGHAFVTSNRPAHGVTTDGLEFFGERWSDGTPPGLVAVGLSDRIGSSTRPCAVYQVHVSLPPDSADDLHFVLGAAESRDEALQLIADAQDSQWISERHALLRERWASMLDVWQVDTTNVPMDAMLNRWLLYQVISSRIWGRLGFYQASGGFGFRDQLQDVLAVLEAAPDIAREHILLAASRQFEEGDVLHWWHEGPLRGVRTRCSDDLLWLAYAVAEFTQVTGDDGVLEESVPFLSGELLQEHEQERYAEYEPSSQSASLYEHCCRAIDARLAFGAHGMPFIGNGDWCDGLNRVGQKGRGESVWMAWFLIIVCRQFAPLCRRMDDAERAAHYEAIASELLERTQTTTWTGEWYLRGYYDDGTPLGAPGDDESEIDLIAQTWAVLADPAHPQNVNAMQAVRDRLIDQEHGLIKLLTPPFDKTPRDPGYIKAYPPGVRENGGQYTHAAVWALWAAADAGDADNALTWFQWLNPLEHMRADEDIVQYRLEPYVLAGDVYSEGVLAGRGGWSWYTGSAGWLYRFGLQKLLGFQRRDKRLFIRPCLPTGWPDIEATCRHRSATYHFCLHSPGRLDADEAFIAINGQASEENFVRLEDEGEFQCHVFADADARSAWLDAHASREDGAPSSMRRQAE